MADTETLGRRPGCSVLSIGGVEFDAVSGLGRTFYRNIDRASCLAVGLVEDPETVAWWEGQSAEAKASLEVDQIPLIDALMEFADFYRETGAETLYAHGPNFDEVILVAAFEACGLPIPWHYRAPRCTRTLYDLANVDIKSGDYSVGVEHNALADAMGQALAAVDAMRRLMGVPKDLDPVVAVNALVADIHADNVAAGWWHDPAGAHFLETQAAKFVVGTKLCLVHSEISEAMEGHRKGLVDDKLPHRSMAEVEFADAVIRICDLAGALGYDLGGAIAEKRAFNSVRPDHKAEVRAAAGGKAY